MRHSGPVGPGGPAFAILLAICFALQATPAAVAYPYGQNVDDGAGGVDRQGQPKQRDTSPIERSRRQIMDLSERELKRLLAARDLDYRTGEYRRSLQIHGFSGVMSDWVTNMLITDRRRTQRLLRSLEGIGGNAERRAILEREARRVDALIDNIEDSIDRLLTRNPEAVTEEAERLGSFKEFRKGLTVWLDYPWEGNR